MYTHLLLKLYKKYLDAHLYLLSLETHTYEAGNNSEIVVIVLVHVFVTNMFCLYRGIFFLHYKSNE